MVLYRFASWLYRRWDWVYSVIRAEWIVILWGIFALTLVVAAFFNNTVLSDPTILLGALVGILGWLLNAINTRRQNKIQSLMSLMDQFRTSRIFLSHYFNVAKRYPIKSTIPEGDLKNLVLERAKMDVLKEEKGKVLFDDFINVPTLDSIIYILNYIEIISAAVNEGKADGRHLRLTYENTLFRYFERFLFFIAYENRGNRNGSFCEFIKLLNRWYKRRPVAWDFTEPKNLKRFNLKSIVASEKLGPQKKVDLLNQRFEKVFMEIEKSEKTIANKIAEKNENPQTPVWNLYP